MKLACQDDGTCEATPQLGCTNPIFSNFDSTATTKLLTGGAIDNLTYGVGGFHTNDDGYGILIVWKMLL